MEALVYYTVELASPPDGWRRLPQLADAARRASEQMSREGAPVRFLRSIFVPEDETCFYVYRAASAVAVREAVRRAGLSVECVVATVSDSEGG